MSDTKYKCSTKQQIAAAYGVNRGTIHRWIKKLLPTMTEEQRAMFGANNRNAIMKPGQIKLLVEKWGEPTDEKYLTA